jgi:glycosyltransferase involved in cell wall biosynthesis
MIRVFILAKDETANIPRCLDSLQCAGWPVTVLDSGSTDATPAICRARGAAVVGYLYRSHAAAYNEITAQMCTPADHALVLDADMRVPAPLSMEIETVVAECPDCVLAAPVEMWWEGVRLRRGSLCPDKALLFRGGRTYFEAFGHGERLVQGLEVRTLRNAVVHDDRKDYSAYLASQVRYADYLLTRIDQGRSGWKDRLRSKTPFLAFIIPFYSLVIKCGWSSGRAGWIYALDRMIAEAIQYRQSVAARLHSTGHGR